MSFCDGVDGGCFDLYNGVWVMGVCELVFVGLEVVGKEVFLLVE